MRRKVWRCKICGTTQEYSAQSVICKNCGTDLSMGPGEITFLGDHEPEIREAPKVIKEPKVKKEPKPVKEPKPKKEPKAAKEPKPKKEPKAAKEPKTKKEPKSRKIWWIVLLVLLVVVALLYLIGSTEDNWDDTAQVTTTAPTTQPITEAPTQPTATEPTQPITEEPTQPTATEPTQPITEEPTQPTATEPTQPITEEPTQPTTTEPTVNTAAVAPDFQFFAGEQVTLSRTYSFDWVEQRSYLTANQTAADAFTAEYCNLVENSYYFKKVDQYTVTKKDGWLVEAYCYSYQGDAQLDDYRLMIDDDRNTKMHHLTVQKCSKSDNYFVDILYSKELNFEFNKTRTTYGTVEPVDTVVSIPEFHSFAGENATWDSGKIRNEYAYINYEVPSKAAAEHLLAEYRTLLEDQFPFDLTYETTYDDRAGWHRELFFYQYTGSGSVDTFPSEIDAEGNTTPTHYKVALLENDGKYFIQVTYAKGIYPELKNVRTTYSSS